MPPSSRRETANPASAKTLSIARLSGITSATNSEIPASAADSASCSSRRVPTPRPCSSSATVNATSADEGSRSRTKLASATMRSESSSPDSAPISEPLSSQSGSRKGSTVAGVSEGKPWKRQ